MKQNTLKALIILVVMSPLIFTLKDGPTVSGSTNPEIIATIFLEAAPTQPNLIKSDTFHNGLYRFNAFGNGTLKYFSQTIVLSQDIEFDQIPTETDFTVYRDGVWQAVKNKITLGTPHSVTITFTFEDNQTIIGSTEFEVVSIRPIIDTSSNEDIDFIDVIFIQNNPLLDFPPASESRGASE